MSLIEFFGTYNSTLPLRALRACRLSVCYPILISHRAVTNRLLQLPRRWPQRQALSAFRLLLCRVMVAVTVRDATHTLATLGAAVFFALIEQLSELCIIRRCR